MIDVRDRLRSYAGGKAVCMDTVSSACQAGIDEIDRLRAKNARLREALKDARNNGLIYWEPRTERGHVSKAQMLSRIDAALAGEEEKP